MGWVIYIHLLKPMDVMERPHSETHNIPPSPSSLYWMDECGCVEATAKVPRVELFWDVLAERIWRCRTKWFWWSEFDEFFRYVFGGLFHVTTNLIWKLKLWFHLFSNGREKKTWTKAYSFNWTGWLVPKISKHILTWYKWNITNPKHHHPRSVSRVLSTHLHGITP